MAIETCSVKKLREFLKCCGERDMQITINRRFARELLAACTEPGPSEDVFDLSGEEYDKLLTYLSMSDNAVRDANNQISVYAFVRIISTLRRRIRDRFGPTPATSTAAQSIGHGEDPGFAAQQPHATAGVRRPFDSGFPGGPGE